MFKMLNKPYYAPSNIISHIYVHWRQWAVQIHKWPAGAQLHSHKALSIKNKETPRKKLTDYKMYSPQKVFLNYFSNPWVGHTRGRRSPQGHG